MTLKVHFPPVIKYHVSDDSEAPIESPFSVHTASLPREAEIAE